MIVLPSSVVGGSPGKEGGGLPEDLGEHSKGSMGGAEANAIMKNQLCPTADVGKARRDVGQTASCCGPLGNGVSNLHCTTVYNCNQSNMFQSILLLRFF